MNTKDNPENRIAETMPVGIVLERRDSDNKWLDHQWRVVEVLPGGVDKTDWTVLRQGEGWIHYYCGALDIELFRRETEGYKVNLSNDPPLVWVVLRDDDDAEESGHEVKPQLATVCPYESQDYQDSGEETVDGVPMPPAVVAWVSDFTDLHHVDEVFVKRKRKTRTAEDAFGDDIRRKPKHG